MISSPPVFPLGTKTHPSFSFNRKPTYATIVQTGRQGREVGAAQQATPLWEFELRYEVLRDVTQNIDATIPEVVKIHGQSFVELQNLLGLYLACAGQYGVFLFDDSTDNSRTSQVLGSGDSSTLVFPFVRTITGDSGLYFTEAVGAVNINFSPIVYLDGTPVPALGNWSISTDLTQLVFVSPPGLNVLISTTFHYYYKCRWISDYQEVEEFVDRFWEAKSVKFRSVRRAPYTEPVAIDPIEPPEPPTPVLTNCLKQFQWFNNTTNLASTTNVGSAITGCPGNQGIDKFGNLWLCAADTSNSFLHKVTIYAPTGGQIQEYSQSDLADEIDSWFGSSIVDRAVISVNNGFYARPIMQGNYVLAYLGATFGPVTGNLAKWFAVIDPDSGGSLNVVGACYFSNLTGPPYSQINILDAANGQSVSDPLLFTATAFPGGWTGVIGVLPSVDDMSSGLLSTVILGVDYPCMVPTTMLYPIGNADLSDRFFTGTSSSRSKFSGFIVPNDADESVLYMYVNRGYTDFCVSNSYVLADKEIKDVLAPTYTQGCMLKVNLGSLDWAVLSTTPLGATPYFGDATPNYSVDNANWKTSGGTSVVPFPDEYKYISSGVIGGKDVYSPQPAAVLDRGGGKFWIPFYMAGIDDAQNNQLGLIWEALRLFEWDATTEVGTLLVYDNCVLHTMGNVNITGGPTPFWAIDDYQAMEFVDDAGTITISVRGLVYDTKFYQFTYP